MTQNTDSAVAQLRSAAEMAAHLVDLARCVAPAERADVLAELIDKAWRRGRISAETAAHLTERAAEICALCVPSQA